MADGRHITPKVSPSRRQEGGDGVRAARKGIMFVTAASLVYLIYLVMSGQMGEFVSALSQVDMRWVAGAVACWGAYYALGVLAYAIGAARDPKCPLGVRDLMSVEATGVFFSFLTPNGTGGAPAQIVRLSRAGLSAGEAGAFQYTRFIIYEACEGIFAALMLLFRGQWFFDAYGDVALVGAILFGLKIGEVLELLLVCLLPKQVVRLGDRLLALLGRCGWFAGRVGGWRETMEREVSAFAAGFRGAMSDVPEMLAVTGVTLVQLGCQYALPWFALRAFGLPADVVTCLACGSVLELLTSAVPLPGGEGGAEGGFAYLFGAMFGPALSAGYVVWRITEYFLPILVSLPLMTLRSSHRVTLHVRVRRLRERVGRACGRLVRAARRMRGEVTGRRR